MGGLCCYAAASPKCIPCARCSMSMSIDFISALQHSQLERLNRWATVASDLISAVTVGPARKRGHVASRGRVAVAPYPNSDRHRDRLPYYALVRALSCSSLCHNTLPPIASARPFSPPSLRGPVSPACDGWFATGMAYARNPYSKARYDQGIDAKIVVMGNTGQ